MQVNVNGKSFNVPNGSSVSIINNVVYVNGQPYEGDGYESKEFRIEVIGGIADLKVERGDVTIKGDVNGTVDVGGNVDITGNVTGAVDVGGNFTCGGSVGGDVDAGGNVKCGPISGDVDAGGNVRHG